MLGDKFLKFSYQNPGYGHRYQTMNRQPIWESLYSIASYQPVVYMIVFVNLIRWGVLERNFNFVRES